jgi:hypothetical protein
MLPWILIGISLICLVSGIILTIRTVLLLRQPDKAVDAFGNQLFALSLVVVSLMLSTIARFVK